MIRRLSAALAVLAVLILASCSSIPSGVDPAWSEEMFFKNAQDAMDQSRYDLALYYYEVYLVRYPEDIPRGIAAEYERSFIQYKTGHLDEAEAGYKALIDKYDNSPYAALYPPRFRELCDIGLKNIARSRAVNNKLFWRRKEAAWAESQGESLLDTSGGTDTSSTN